ncbi:xanthine dehydrogenase family protein subunit M [Micromonospora sp. 4G57]|uniref:Xanthine dehydrogenase family protein subunit M n=1 Tax=Micromonospora sicca TaxID=2202420 RepID=A0ABU5JH65_9ACTN|nr:MULTISPECIES: xanthine dehydrogenase family protein subunit M [unclassified Micromonospora]MDZ5443957.1 xanthine dehydrogenase family protein subunit M [Micromonospora sp. 4G57]MDZ5491916.1 xanthine dehydrogenase family protein subunit M [Micromonospora sp. 4G53]
MRAFRYHRPADVTDAVALLDADPEAAYLGGGTNLVDLMKLGVQRPGLLVDVTGLPLDTVEPGPDGGLRIGATVRNSDLAAHPLVRRDYPLLARALLDAASGQVRNMATTGGNLLQRTRCAYFQDTAKACNKREPGTGCAALHGQNRELAILGWSERCVATHPSDLAVALVALDAVAEVREPDGPRDVPLTELHRTPGHHPERETTLPRGALITAVRVPPLPFARRSTYLKVRDRAAFAFAVGSVAAALDLDGDVVRDVRLAYGAVAHRPWRAYRAEELLRGRPFTAELAAQAADAELAAARPLRHNGFKVPLIRNLTVRALTGLAGSVRP